jgi:hypothetical protein
MLFKRQSTPRHIRHDHPRALQMQRYLHSHALTLIDYNARLIFNIIRNESVSRIRNLHYQGPTVTALSDSTTTKNMQRHVQQELSLFHESTFLPF